MGMVAGLMQLRMDFVWRSLSSRIRRLSIICPSLPAFIIHISQEALNAGMAVVKLKKIRGFDRYIDREPHSTYTTDGNMLLNGDRS